MKESTGEFSMTAIVLIGAIAIAGIVAFLVPNIRNYVRDTWDDSTTCEDADGDMICD